MKNLFFSALLLIPIIAYSQNTRVIDWDSDLNVLKTGLPKSHINLYKQKSEKDFLYGIEKISRERIGLYDFDVAVKIQQLIASMGDSHTAAAWGMFADNKRILPLGLYWFKDGIYVVTTTVENQSILGYKILKINDKPVASLIDSLRTVLTADNNAVIKKDVPNLIPYIQLLEHFGFTDSDNVDLLLENNSGESLTYTIRPSMMNRQNRISVIPESVALCYKLKSSLFADTILKDENVYYIQYNQCAAREFPPSGFRGNAALLPSFFDFGNKIIENINSHDFAKVIFDIRFNSGGSSLPGTELIGMLSTIKKLNEKGKLYVIVGRQTFSSAIINAMDFKNKTTAIFAGEETAGKPNHFGEIRPLELPGSGLRIMYSTKYFQRTAGNPATLTPDQVIEQSYSDFKNGRDPVYEWVIKQ